MSHLFRYTSYFLNDDEYAYFMYKVGYREGLKTQYLTSKASWASETLTTGQNLTFLFVFSVLPQKEVQIVNIIY